MVLAVAAALFLGASGAFGTGSAPYGLRFGYWLSIMVLGGLLGDVVARLYERMGWLEQRPTLQVAAVGLSIAVPFVVVVWAATALWFDRPLRLSELSWFILPVGLVSLPMTALNFLVNRQPRETHASPEPDAAPPRFLDRLPVKLKGADLYAVSAEDHYLRLHTSRGSDLILMRLSDAVSELEGLEGAQTHRSWWVAKDAVTKTTRGEGRASLTLLDGTVAPVSRTYVKALRDEGWFRT